MKKILIILALLVISTGIYVFADVYCADLSRCYGGGGCLGYASVEGCRINCSLGGTVICPEKTVY
jgi:predicted oxidoreductase